jgi:glycosyltransferase involved in cell wall biosynthesis
MAIMIEISVVIGTYNQKTVLSHVLDSFSKQTFPSDKMEVLVVDSSSDDGTEELCTNSKFPFIFNYYRKENTGKVPARNMAIEKAGGEVIFLTDGDVLAHPSLIEEHMHYYRKYPGSVIVGRQMIVPSLEHYEEEGKICFKRDNKVAGQRLSWDHLVTGNAFIGKKMLVDIGMFDEDFKGYGCEDYELGYRIAKKNIPIIYNPDAINYHYHPVTFEEDCIRKIDTGKAAVIFWKKHKSLQLKFYLGINPLSLFIHSFISSDGWIIKKCRKYSNVESMWKNIARQILLEFNYLTGVKEEFYRK